MYKEGNSYCKKVYLGKDCNGKKKYKKFKATTQKELNKKIIEFKKALDTGLDVQKSTDTLKVWSVRYLNSLEKDVDNNNLSLSEFKTKKARIEYFLQYKGGILAVARLCDILPIHIQPAIDDLYKRNPYTNKESSKRTISRYIFTLANVFDFAKAQRAYNFPNPCDSVKNHKNANQKEVTALNSRSISLVMTTEHRAKTPANIMLMAGLRRGELTSLTWDSVDLSNKVIYISAAYDFKNHNNKSPKTEAGVRKIYICDYLVDLLKEAKSRSTGKYVIEKSRGGGRMTEQAWHRMMESYMIALRKADEETENNTGEYFEEFTLHQLRHTYCSLLYWSGVDTKTAQSLMGHSDYCVTENTYTHATDSAKFLKAVELQNKYIKERLIEK